MASPLLKLEVKDILEMSAEDLKKTAGQRGFDPKGLTKAAMQDLLIRDILKPALEEKPAEYAPSESGVAFALPAFVAKLSPELQLQWFLEDSKIKAQRETEEAKMRASRETEES
jgi:hypothetical protein